MALSSPHSPQEAASSVDDRFEVGFDADFETRFERWALAGRVLLCLFILACLAGRLGRGPFSHASARAPDGSLSVDYEPVARYDTPTTITLHVPSGPAAPIRLSSTLVEPMGLVDTVPGQAIARARGGDPVLMLAPQRGDPAALIRLHARPGIVGPVRLEAQVQGFAPVAWTQVIVP
jgi:hypothetical protein